MRKEWICPSCFFTIAPERVLLTGQHGLSNQTEPEAVADIKDFLFRQQFYQASPQILYRFLIQPRLYHQKLLKRFKTGFPDHLGQARTRLCPHCHQRLPEFFGKYPVTYIAIVTTLAQICIGDDIVDEMESLCYQLGYSVERDGLDKLYVTLTNQRQLVFTRLHLPIDCLEELSESARYCLLRQIEKSDTILWCFGEVTDRRRIYYNLSLLNAHILHRLEADWQQKTSNRIIFDTEEERDLWTLLQQSGGSNAHFIETMFGQPSLSGRFHQDDVAQLLETLVRPKKKGVLDDLKELRTKFG